MIIHVALKVVEHRSIPLDRDAAEEAAVMAATIAVLCMPGAYSVESARVVGPAMGTAVLADPADA
jgi:hypothetical protein